MKDILDLGIIGGGPAGLTASIFASRYGISNIVFTDLIGGMASEAFKVENYPGIKGISGLELVQKMAKHATSLGGKILLEKVKKIEPVRMDLSSAGGKEKNILKVFTSKKEYLFKAIILATGTEKRKLKVVGEKEFLGKGVAYCATCDAPFFKNKTVTVVGGGNSAVTSAILLSQYSKKIYILNIEKNLLADLSWQKEIEKNKKIEVINENTVKEIKGKKTVEEIILKNPFKGKKILKTEGVFIEIGTVPLYYLAKNLRVKLDKKGFVEVSENLSTNVAGVFAAGDITNYSANLRQIITAASEGAIAATSAYNYLKVKN